MKLLLDEVYTDIHGYQLIPLFEINGNYNGDELSYICLCGYHQPTLDKHGLTRPDINGNQLVKGDYIDLIARINSILLHKNVTTDIEFTSFISLNELSCSDKPFKVGECYFNPKQNEFFYFYKKYKEHFFYVLYTSSRFNINTLEVFRMYNNSAFSYDYTFITDFNRYCDEWIKVPKFYFDISIGRYGYTIDEIQSVLTQYKRKEILNKIIK